MSRTNPEQIIAHVDLLRAVDRLLAQADTVRAKREALDRLLPEPTDTRGRQAANKEGTRDG